MINNNNNQLANNDAKKDDLILALRMQLQQISGANELYSSKNERLKTEKEIAEEKAKVAEEKVKVAEEKVKVAEENVAVETKRRMDAEQKYNKKIRRTKEETTFNDMLAEGTFFSPIDQVWNSEENSFIDFEITTFHRNDKDLIPNDYYTKTVTLASNSDYEVALNSPRSAVDTPMIDIFGQKNTALESAHLLPHAETYSPFWFPFVPMIVCAKEPRQKNSWKFFEKCIQGSKKKYKNHEDKPCNRENGSGIKHFRTNRVRLNHQKHIYDDNPCVIIVPLLSVDNIIDWNGGSYNAIVLVGASGTCTDDDFVHRILGIGHGMRDKKKRKSFLASEIECELACDLLKKMILCICNNIVNAPIEFGINLRKHRSSTTWKSAVNSIEASTSAPVPTMIHWNDATKVRKISFSSGQIPDPMLLLAKAVSNWLKCNNMYLLPG